MTTAPELRDVLEELRSREPIFHHPELDTGRADFERMTAKDFWEVGASGRRHSREHVLEVLTDRSRIASHLELEDTWETVDFACRGLGGETYLLSYTLLQGTDGGYPVDGRIDGLSDCHRLPLLQGKAQCAFPRKRPLTRCRQRVRNPIGLATGIGARGCTGPYPR